MKPRKTHGRFGTRYGEHTNMMTKSENDELYALTARLNMAKIIIGSIAVSGQGYDNWNPALKASVKKFMEL